MKNWKRLGSRVLLTHPRLQVYEDDVELPNGHRTTYLHFGDLPDAGMVLARNDEGMFLIQKEYSYPPDEALFQLPGGAINKNESPLKGAAREFAEEAGLAGELKLLGWFYLHNRRSKQKMFIYLATGLHKATAQKDIEEEFEDFWFTEAKIDMMIRTNEIRNYTLLAGWALYKASK
jgi:ADP-ribose pyrophosphatase